MSTIGKPLAITPDADKNADHLNNLRNKLKAVTEKIREGGGKAARERLKARGKLPARERIAKLIDPGTYVVEIGALAAYGMYEEAGGAPSAGVVVVLGIVSGRQCLIL